MALGCGGEDDGASKDRDLDAGDQGGDRTGRQNDGGSGRTAGELDGGSIRRPTEIDAGIPRAGTDTDAGSGSSVDLLQAFLAGQERAEELECACLAGAGGEVCADDGDARTSNGEWEAYATCLRDAVALDTDGSAAFLGCALSVTQQYNACVAELTTCSEDPDATSTCGEAADDTGSRCPALPDAVREAWESCETVVLL